MTEERDVPLSWKAKLDLKAPDADDKIHQELNREFGSEFNEALFEHTPEKTFTTSEVSGAISKLDELEEDDLVFLGEERNANIVTALKFRLDQHITGDRPYFQEYHFILEGQPNKQNMVLKKSIIQKVFADLDTGQPITYELLGVYANGEWQKAVTGQKEEVLEQQGEGGSAEKSEKLSLDDLCYHLVAMFGTDHLEAEVVNGTSIVFKVFSRKLSKLETLRTMLNRFDYESEIQYSINGNYLTFVEQSKVEDIARVKKDHSWINSDTEPQNSKGGA